MATKRSAGAIDAASVWVGDGAWSEDAVVPGLAAQPDASRATVSALRNLRSPAGKGIQKTSTPCLSLSVISLERYAWPTSALDPSDPPVRHVSEVERVLEFPQMLFRDGRQQAAACLGIVGEGDQLRGHAGTDL